MSKENKDIYLTFKTDYKTHYLLKTMAHVLGKTQPEFINEILQHYMNSTMNDIEEKIKEHKIENKNSP